ncbi:MAG: hypothetical protein N3F05_02525 [Candidatus Diapherotrites archaeon]|nr:hypothetical protein [Candidatus Diapherotrites archaeon]
MVTASELMEIGFTEEQAKSLLENDYFKKQYCPWTKERLTVKINLIISFYGIKNAQKVFSAVSQYPQFLSTDHEKALLKINEFIPQLKKNKIAELILANPYLVSMDCKKAFSSALKVYGKENAPDVLLSLLTFPGFSRKNHKKNLQKLLKIYGDEYKQSIIQAMLRVPDFPNFNHKEAIKKVFREGKAAGLTDKQCVEILLNIGAKADFSLKSAKEAKAAFEKIVSAE